MSSDLVSFLNNFTFFANYCIVVLYCIIKVGCCVLKLVVVYKLNEIGNEYLGQENLVGL